MDGGKWLALGWRHPVWDLVRYFLSLRGGKGKEWLAQLRLTNQMKIGEADAIAIDSSIIELFFAYLDDREANYSKAFGLLRTENEALKYCKKKSILVSKTTTKNQEHHQSSKAVVATVSAIVAELCRKQELEFITNPQTRCAWCVNNKLHVTARNIDGAIPALANPKIIWEIKEYWGKTKGGSKMSDAVYECNLVGRELRDFEEISAAKIQHVVFLDGKKQWTARKSDLKRFIDLTHQGLIDHIFIGRDIEVAFPLYLKSILGK